MNETAISDTLLGYLASVKGSLPIVYENEQMPDGIAKPYLVTQMVRVSRRALDLAGGGGIIAKGYLQVSVVADIGSGQRDAELAADQVASNFLKGQRIAGTGGEITITGAPRMFLGAYTGDDWRVVIQIDYWATAR